MEGIADADFPGLASARWGSTKLRVLAQWAMIGNCAFKIPPVFPNLNGTLDFAPGVCGWLGTFKSFTIFRNG